VSRRTADPGSDRLDQRGRQGTRIATVLVGACHQGRLRCRPRRWSISWITRRRRHSSLRMLASDQEPVRGYRRGGCSKWHEEGIDQLPDPSGSFSPDVTSRPGYLRHRDRHRPPATTQRGEALVSGMGHGGFPPRSVTISIRPGFEYAACGCSAGIPVWNLGDSRRLRGKRRRHQDQRACGRPVRSCSRSASAANNIACPTAFCAVGEFRCPAIFDASAAPASLSEAAPPRLQASLGATWIGLVACGRAQGRRGPTVRKAWDFVAHL